jgi:AcrR family transcriptional regulator
MPNRDARAAMIDAAERIVAERGLAALTLREVQTESGQANKSAAQYHFGSRQGLLEAVLEDRGRPVDEMRRAALHELEALETPTTPQLVEALVRPLAAATIYRRDSCHARFLAQAIFAPELSELMAARLRAGIVQEIWDRLVLGSRLPRSTAMQRMSSVVVLTLSTLAAHEGRRMTRRAADLVVRDLVDTCVGVLEAPSTVPLSGGQR